MKNEVFNKVRLTENASNPGMYDIVIRVCGVEFVSATPLSPKTLETLYDITPVVIERFGREWGVYNEAGQSVFTDFFASKSEAKAMACGAGFVPVKNFNL